MCMNKVRYATSYQIHSTLLLNPSYTSYTSPLKKGIKSIAPFSFFVPTKKKRPKTPPKSARMLVAISPTIPCQPREALEEDGPLEVQAHQGTGPGETVPPSTGGFKFEPEFLRERFVKFLDMWIYIYIYSCIYVGNRGFICCIRYASTDWVKVFSFFFHTMFPKCVEILKMWHLRCKHGLLLSCLRIRQLPHTVADEHIWGLMGSNG